MDLTSSTFLFAAALVVLAFRAAPNRTSRVAVFTAANAFFIASYVSRPVQVLPLALFVLLGYACANWVGPKARDATLVASIAAILAAFIFLKQFSFLRALPRLPFAYLSVGLSYILFRMLHVVVDAHAGEIPKAKLRNPISFFNYTCNFLCFVSGPIQRYTNFEIPERTAREQLDREIVFKAFLRVINGFIKIVVFSGTANYLFLNLSEPILGAHTQLSAARLVPSYCGAVVSYTGYLYFNFAGYMDVVIGIGWLLGMDLPENFDKPFSSRSFLEFWNRWHITLSNWFKVYLFNPTLQVLAERFPAPALMPLFAVLTFFLTFMVMGVWHGTTAVFVIYGVLMGAGASANKLWQLVMAKVLGKKRYRAWGERALYSYVCRGLTFAYFSIAVTCLWVDMAQLASLTTRLGPRGVACALLAITGAAALAAALWSATGRALRAAGALLGRSDGLIWRNAMLGTRVLLIMAVGSFFHRAPEFVYKAF